MATSVAGIPELIEDGRTGMLVAPESPAALALALEALIVDPARRRELGEAGRRRVRAGFGLEENIERLARRFGLKAAD